MTYIDDLFSLRGKVSLVTGAARGNGLGIARALLAAGARTFLADILESDLKEAVASLKDRQFEAVAVTTDLTAPGAPEELVKTVVTAAGRLDILVNNAGITRPANVLEVSERDWDETQATNLKAPFLLSQAAARAMIQTGAGSIINVTSLNAEIAFPNNPAYVASKGGLKMLGKSLGLDLAQHNIRVNNIGPGYFRTEMTNRSWSDAKLRKERTSRTALKRWGDPDRDLAGVVIFLASDASSYVTGQDIYVDGGWLINGL